MSTVEKFLTGASQIFPGRTELTISELKSLPKQGVKVPGAIWGCYMEGTRPKRFSLEVLRSKTGAPAVEEPVANVALMEIGNAAVSLTMDEEFSQYIPVVDKDFVPTGENYQLLHKIVESGEYFPTYIYGISGVGKTASIEHICASLGKPFFRCQITAETIDEDLIGSMKLIDGNTVWQDGPVIKAYRSGGIIVLDEVDLNAGLMILQPILERKPFYIKQTGELVHPQDGFMVFATGNTKGDGLDARYIGTTVLNEAFLERFAVVMEQGFPDIQEETRIAKLFCQNNGISIPGKLLRELMKLVDSSRQTYVAKNYSGVYISTRRIRFILKAWKIVGNISKAIQMTMARFPESEREAIDMLWKSIHAEESDETVSE